MKIIIKPVIYALWIPTRNVLAQVGLMTGNNIGFTGVLDGNDKFKVISGKRLQHVFNFWEMFSWKTVVCIGETNVKSFT